jgi:hypothetical protein
MNKWIDVNKKMPSENETVWLLNENDKFIRIGCRVYEQNEGWFWAISNGIIYIENNKIVSECEIDDDYEITHWQKMPSLPKS